MADGVFTGLRALDLSWGIAGPIATMLLADHGCSVTHIDRPQGDPFGDWSAYRVWHRGKRRATLDLRDHDDREVFLRLADAADVLVESFSPGVSARLGIDYETLAARNERLVYCSITGYGRGTVDQDRPGIDALVAARTGLHFEQRGWPGGSVDRLSGRALRKPDLEYDPDGVSGALRDGPLFNAVPWPSLASAYWATAGIGAALRAREVTGRGQWVETSLLQGALTTGFPWQRAEHPDAPNYWTFAMDSRAPHGFFRCSDGQWVLFWPMNPRFVLSVSGGERLAIPDGEDLRPRADPSRIGIGEDDLVTICAYYPILAEIFAQYPAAEWAAVAAQANVALQVVRSPEAAFADPSLHADGCVVDLDDPELGRLTQVGRVVELTRSAGRPSVPAVAPGTHTEAVRSETPTPSVAPRRSPAPLAAPLTGIRVLDLGLAVAGPFGCQVLADLGAEVIKINTLHDGYWHSNHIAMGANRGKRSLAVNLKHPDGMAILRELVPTADVVHTNMRYDAAQRLGVDEASLRALNPTMIYCHTRGFERGDRELLPGNDQTGGALAGGQWEDGGLSDGGRPIWSLTTLGDTGNGFLSAIGVVMALYDRERTGEGQRVDTSILYAHLLNVSAAMLRNGEPIERPRLDSQQLGLAPTYRIYATADAWVCVGAWTAEQIAAFAATGATDAERTAWFAERRADSAIGALAALGVPIERCDEGFAMRAFDDSDFIARRWVADFRHRRVGRVDMAGLAVDFSDTPGVLGLGPVLVGQETREILRDLGHDDAQIDAWCAAKVVFDDPEPT